MPCLPGLLWLPAVTPWVNMIEQSLHCTLCSTTRGDFSEWWTGKDLLEIFVYRYEAIQKLLRVNSGKVLRVAFTFAPRNNL